MNDLHIRYLEKIYQYNQIIGTVNNLNNIDEFENKVISYIKEEIEKVRMDIWNYFKANG